MSDFIFSNIKQVKGKMEKCLKNIYHNNKPKVIEFHGNWGSLAVSRNLYNGFQPLETERHILVVIGGPVLYFRDNLFLTGENPTTGTQAIYERYVTKKIRWDEDLSGPFVVLIVDKLSSGVTCVTDLMMFIPVYQYMQNGNVLLATHVDSLASAAGQLDNIDSVSLVDFVLHGVITHPYTAYKNLHQLYPAAIHSFKPYNGKLHPIKPNMYWMPNEINPYTHIKQAALAIRKGINSYISRVTEGMTEVAQFLSAGEDSRSIAGFMPKRLKRNAYIFLDCMNREGRIAKRVATLYGLKFHVAFRSKTHYLNILPEASDLVGIGHQYLHAHSLGFHKSCRLNYYTAVFGGYLSDCLLKGHRSNKTSFPSRYPFMPEFFTLKETRSEAIRNSHFAREALRLVDQRRKLHLTKVQKFRKRSSHEWFTLWPATMIDTMPNLYANRRLLRMYEPFMCKESVKISAAAPIQWKLNRRLFRLMAKQSLKQARYIPRADDRLPYFPWWYNNFYLFSKNLCKK